MPWGSGVSVPILSIGHIRTITLSNHLGASPSRRLSAPGLRFAAVLRTASPPPALSRNPTLSLAYDRRPRKDRTSPDGWAHAGPPWRQARVELHFPRNSRHPHRKRANPPLSSSLTTAPQYVTHGPLRPISLRRQQPAFGSRGVTKQQRSSIMKEYLTDEYDLMSSDGLVAKHLIKSAFNTVGDHVAALEKRMDRLEKKRGSARGR